MSNCKLFIITSFFLSIMGLSALDGKKVYQKYCMACHGEQGIPVSEVFPPLAGSEWVKGDAGRIVEIILGGLAGEITVKGKQYNLLMPTQGASMTDEEIAAAATYVRSSWGHKETPVAPQFVKNLRSNVEIGESLEAHKVLAKYPLPATLELKNCVSQVATFENKLPLTKQAITTATAINSDYIPHPKNTLIPNASQYYEGSHRVLHTGDLEVFADGKYDFKLTASEWAEVKLEGKVITTSTDGKLASTTMELKAGTYPITVQSYASSNKKLVLFDILKQGSKAFHIGKRSAPSNIWVPKEKPLIYRNILKDSSARGMAIGFPSGLNILLDLESSLLTKIWSGDFINVNTHFIFRGEFPAGAAGEDVFILNRPLKVRNESVNLKSYKLNPAGEPVFSYQIGNSDLLMFYTSPAGNKSIKRTFATSSPQLGVEIARLKDGQASLSEETIETKRWKITSSTGFRIATEGADKVVYIDVTNAQTTIVNYLLK